MQEIMVDTGDWKAFWDRWRDTADALPGLKGAMLERIGGQIRDEVRGSVDRSGLNDSRGRVKLWQNPHVGEGRGYVAVRSDSVEVAAGYKDRQVLNAGALTNFLSSGHKVRGPSGRAKKRYHPRARMTRVNGLDFYGKARAESEKIAIQEAEDFMRRLTVTELKL